MTIYLLLKASQIMHPKTCMILYLLHGASNLIMIYGKYVYFYQSLDMYIIDIFWSKACMEMNHTHTRFFKENILKKFFSNMLTSWIGGLLKMQCRQL